jgi:hypothetical protein
MFIAVGALACSGHVLFADAGCKEALAQDSVCETANAFATNVMKSRHLIAVSVVQKVGSGALVLFGLPSRPR